MTDITVDSDGFDSIVDLTEGELGRRVVTVRGEVDIANAPKLHEHLIEALNDPNGDVLVDLRGVSFIDSTGLGVLVNARQRARNTGATLKLALPEGQARFPFEVTGLATLFERHEPAAADRPDGAVPEIDLRRDRAAEVASEG